MPADSRSATGQSSRKPTTRDFLAGFLAMMMLCTAAYAGAKQDREARDSADEGSVGVEANAKFNKHERELVRGYYVESRGKGHCPPGLAKKQNGCLPPGQAKKRYAVGRPLDSAVVIVPVPPSLEVRIGPPPAGYTYGMVDGDLVKLAVGTHLVVDAVNSLVH